MTSSKFCESLYMVEDNEVDNERSFTLKSLGAPKLVQLPVDIFERQKFSKTSSASLLKKPTADEVLSKKRQDLKKNLKDFIDMAFPSSKNPYNYLLTCPGPVYNLEKFYLANQHELKKPPLYKFYYDNFLNCYFCTLNFNDTIELSDQMPTKILAKLHVAYKTLIKIKKELKVKNEKEKATRRSAEKVKFIREMIANAELAKIRQDKQLNDQPPKKFYSHPRVQMLWANKEREPEDDDWFMENISKRNFSLFNDIYSTFDKSKFISKKRNFDLNEEENIHIHVNKKVRIEKEM
ncbi:hypothetical protein GLOIN_2v190339 [Rhizophagus clarus]|uniref:Uncharacterized protein n=1 Tax=Rhizophagus clarus TaxID=94130 RepID=A0A8H3QIU7_9GLOM|nr:hypothetical protein GLOIN_2v190339 [Rhizophagus clarus]